LENNERSELQHKIVFKPNRNESSMDSGRARAFQAEAGGWRSSPCIANRMVEGDPDDHFKYNQANDIQQRRAAASLRATKRTDEKEVDSDK